MEQGWFERLTEVMGRLAAGERLAMELLYDEYGDPIRGQIRREFAGLGVPCTADEVEGITYDFIVAELSPRAGSWDPSFGATPWHWARLRLRNMVVAWVGQFADPLPEGGPAEAAISAAEPAVDEDEIGRAHV